MSISRIETEHLISLNQENNIQLVLIKYNMQAAKPSLTPMAKFAKLTAEASPKAEEELTKMALVPYRQACKSLQHLQFSTRPDISKATSVACQFFQNLGSSHWTALKRIMRYLKGTKNYELVYRQSQSNIPGQGTLHIEGFTDSDWAGDADQRCSI